MQTPTNKEYLTVFDVAKMFRTSITAIRLKMGRGVFPAETYFRLGRRVYFDGEKLEQWIRGKSTNDRK